MRGPTPLPPSLAGRPFTIDESRAAGVARSRTRASDLAVPFRGVRAVRGSTGVRARCAAYAVRMPPGQHFSHATAALLLGLPLPAALRDDPRIHVTAVSGREPRVRGVVGHLTTRTTPVLDVGGLRVTAPVHTWCLLAATLGLDDLVALGDSLVRRTNPMATMEQLRAAVESWSGCRGARRLRAALDLVRPGTDSARETRIRLIIVQAGLPEPLVNAPILNEFGAFLALGDLVYPEFRVLIEYDGGHHFASVEQAHHDIDRLDAVMEIGWRVIRVNKSHNRHHIVAKVTNALLAAGWRP